MREAVGEGKREGEEGREEGRGGREDNSRSSRAESFSSNCTNLIPSPTSRTHARTHVDPRPSTQAPTNKHAETLFLYLIQCLAGKRCLLQNEHDQRLPNFLEPHLASCARNHVPREIHGGGYSAHRIRSGTG